MLTVNNSDHSLWRPSRSPGRAVWLPALAALLSLFVFALSANLLPAVLLRAAGDLAISPETLAVVSSVQFGAFFLAAACGGMLADHWGRRMVFVLACIVLCGGSAIWALAGRFELICLAAALWGGAGGVFESMSSALLCELFPARRKLFMNLSQVLYTAGAVGGPWLAGWLLPRGVDWRWLFAGVGAWSAGLLILFAACRLPRPEPHERVTPSRLAAALRKRSFLLPCLALFLYVLSESSVVVYANLYLRRAHAAPENWAIYSIALFWAAMLLGRCLCALLPERHSYEQTTGWILIVSAAVMAAQCPAGSWQLSLALFALAGLCLAGGWPLIVAMASARAANHSGTLVGITIAAGSLGCVAAPPLMNLLMRVLPMPLVFVVMAVPLAVAAAGVLGSASQQEMTESARFGQ